MNIITVHLTNIEWGVFNDNGNLCVTIAQDAPKEHTFTIDTTEFPTSTEYDEPLDDYLYDAIKEELQQLVDYKYYPEDYTIDITPKVIV